jgi:hypothetical protein
MTRPFNSRLCGFEWTIRPGGASRGDLYSGSCGNRRGTDACRENDLVGQQSAIRRFDARDPAVLPDETGDTCTGQHGGAKAEAVAEHQLGGGNRFDGTFIHGMQGEFGRVDEIGFDRGTCLPIDGMDVITPAAVFHGISLELSSRQVPAKSAAPAERKGREVFGDALPFLHGAHAQPVVDLGIAPAGIDPGKGIVRRFPAGPVGDDGDHGASPAQMPGDRGADDTGADDDNGGSGWSIVRQVAAPRSLLLPGEDQPAPRTRARPSLAGW